MNDYHTHYPNFSAIKQRRAAGKPLFGLGRLLATPAALDVLTAAQHHPAKLLQQHQCGLWGDLCAEDLAANDDALMSGARLLSVYKVNDIRLYVITEAVSDTGRRECTTILLPSEY